MKMQKDWREGNWRAYDSKCYLPVVHVTYCKKKSRHVTVLHGQVQSIGVRKDVHGPSRVAQTVRVSVTHCCMGLIHTGA